MSSTHLSEFWPEKEGAMELPASFNFRDVGGIPTRTGRTLASGRFYRSGDLTQLDSAVADAFARAIGLRTVIDLRTSVERNEHGTCLFSPTYNRWHCPLFERVLPQWVAPADDSPVATATRYLEMLRDGTDRLVEIVRTLGERDAQPFIIHCLAGRDRTGIVVACLLDVLGVTDDAIASDYALSDLVVNDGGRAHSQAMRHFLQLLREQHGSTVELLSTYGVSSDELVRFSCSLLTD
jgi:hypothetical protein